MHRKGCYLRHKKERKKTNVKELQRSSASCFPESFCFKVQLLPFSSDTVMKFKLQVSRVYHAAASLKDEGRVFRNLPLFWWVKVALILIALVFGLAYTIPTFTGDPSAWPRHDSGEMKGQPRKWGHRFVQNWLPDSRISLGLDLRGGLHLLLEVDTEQSIRDALNRALGRAREHATTAGIKVGAVDIKPDHHVEIELEDPAKKDEFVKMVSDQSYLLTFDRLDGNKLRFVPRQTEINTYTSQILQQAIGTIRNRIDQFGVAEPSIFQQGDHRIVVQMPGLQDPARAKELIGNTARLDFRLVLNEHAQDKLEALITEARAALTLPAEDSGAESVRRISQWLRENKKISANATLMLGRQYDTANKAKITAVQPYLVELNPKLTGDLIEDAQATRGQDSIIPTEVVSLKFKPQGAKIFGDLTTEARKSENAPHQIAIILDENVNSAPVVNEPILTGNAQITMGRRLDSELAAKEAQDLALVLRAGALPAAVKIIEERQVGPSEGEENIRVGLLSSAVAAALVILMMLLIYGNSGLVANFAMIFNVMLILAFLAAFGATLTLPGIAGIVLTMAVAVDGNVIINERIREEMRAGHSVKQAFYKGYDASFGTLVDAHVTSAVAGLVLLVYGNASVKGFAITLLAGIIATLFTSYYVTEVIGQWLVEKTNIKRFH